MALLALVVGLAATLLGVGPASAGAPVLPAISTTTLTSALNPAVLGDSVFFLATVTSAGTPVTTGTADILVDGVVLADDVPLDGGGNVGVSTSALDVGDHLIVASYSGTPGGFSASDDSLVQVVEAPPAIEAPTAIEIASSTNPSTPDQMVSFTAWVTSEDAPVLIGTADIAVDGVTVHADVALGSDGSLGFSTSFADLGTHPVTVTYDANPAYATSTATLDQLVIAAPVDPDPDPTDPDPTSTTSTTSPTPSSTTTAAVPPSSAAPEPGAVAAAATSGSTAGTLPRTGPATSGAALAGMGLVITGSALLAIRRRRTT